MTFPIYGKIKHIPVTTRPDDIYLYKSHKSPFSYGFPMVFLWFSMNMFGSLCSVLVHPPPHPGGPGAWAWRKISQEKLAEVWDRHRPGFKAAAVRFNYWETWRTMIKDHSSAFSVFTKKETHIDWWTFSDVNSTIVFWLAMFSFVWAWSIPNSSKVSCLSITKQQY